MGSLMKVILLSKGAVSQWIWHKRASGHRCSAIILQSFCHHRASFYSRSAIRGQHFTVILQSESLIMSQSFCLQLISRHSHSESASRHSKSGIRWLNVTAILPSEDLKSQSFWHQRPSCYSCSASRGPNLTVILPSKDLVSQSFCRQRTSCLSHSGIRGSRTFLTKRIWKINGNLSAKKIPKTY